VRADRSDRIAEVSRLDRIWNSRVQMLVLALATIAAYYHAFFDVARADQLIYLYRTVGLDLRALTVGSYDFNRSVGDFLLFRPVLYLLLGVERWAWGYHFVGWQATSIGLHVGIVLSLFAYFRQRLKQRPLERASATPFVLALFFALSFAGTEMVAWQHIAGYLLFCLLAVQAALAYQRLLTEPAPRHGAALVGCAGIACFTYELGNVLALAYAAMLLYVQGRRASGEATARRGVLLATGLLLIAAPCGYVLWSWLDYRPPATAAGALPTLDIARLVPRFVGAMAISAGYWFCASLWPAALHLVPGARIQGARPFPLLSVLSAVNLAFCLLMAGAAIPFAFHRRVRQLATDWLPAAAFIVLAASYTAIIVLGRSLERGIIETLSVNSYYAYIFALLLVLALFHLVLVPAEAAVDAQGLRRRRVLLASLMAIALIGGGRIFALHAAMHRVYSGPVEAVLERIDALEAQHGREPDFSFTLAADCPTLLDIPWFAAFARDNHAAPYTVATALFPGAARSQGGKYSVECH
jgi:hypothetical protein